MEAVTGTVVYQLGEFIQVALTLLIMGMLLHTGLKLAWRIHGVTGGGMPVNSKPVRSFPSALIPSDGVNRISDGSTQGAVSEGSDVTNPLLGKSDRSGYVPIVNANVSAGFQSALTRLNTVMLICTVCFLLQVCTLSRASAHCSYCCFCR